MSGCSTTEYKRYYPRNRTGEYQQGVSLPELKTPEGVTVIKPDPYYQIPSVDTSSVGVSILPPGSSLMKEAQSKQEKKG